MLRYCVYQAGHSITVEQPEVGYLILEYFINDSWK